MGISVLPVSLPVHQNGFAKEETGRVAYICAAPESWSFSPLNSDRDSHIRSTEPASNIVSGSLIGRTIENLIGHSILNKSARLKESRIVRYA